MDILTVLRPLGALVLIKDDGSFAAPVGAPPLADDVESDLLTYPSMVPKQVRCTSLQFSSDNLALISKHLRVLSDHLSGITIPSPPAVSESGSPVLDSDTPQLLSSLSREDVV